MPKNNNSQKITPDQFLVRPSQYLGKKVRIGNNMGGIPVDDKLVLVAYSIPGSEDNATVIRMDVS